MKYLNKTYPLLWACILILLQFPACSSPEPELPPPPPPPPETDWASAVDLESIRSEADSLEPLTSLLVLFRDSLVLESYFNGLSRNDYVNVKSVSKSLLSALVGIAIRDSLLHGVDQPIADILPDYDAWERDSLRRAITLRHVLSMTTGLESTSSRNYGAWVSSRNWVRYALEQPRECDPGTCMSYSTGNSHILSTILTRVSGMDTRSYFRHNLLDRMDIYLPPWDRDPQGVYLGGNNMSLRPRDMLAFGQLYLNGGMWEGEQLVPESWVKASWEPNLSSRWSGRRHGYHWWISQFNGENVPYAWGYGGQFIFVIPRMGMVIVTTSSFAEGRERGHNQDIYRLLADHIIPAFLSEP